MCRKPTRRANQFGAFPLSPCGRGWLRQRVGAKRRPMINSAKTGEGSVSAERTPHPSRTSHSRCTASASYLRTAAGGRLRPPSPTRGEERRSTFSEEGVRGQRKYCVIAGHRFQWTGSAFRHRSMAADDKERLAVRRKMAPIKGPFSVSRPSNGDA